MNSFSSVEIRRARPLLGTFVEITASGLAETELHEAVNTAFDVMERIQSLMSAHDLQSELSLINREAQNQAVTVTPETFAVLRRAKRLAAQSNGAFDFTIAPTLARWGMLPQGLRRENAGNWRDVLLLHGGKVLFRCSLALDLGGIAKGFAVDKAVEALRGSGVTAAVVNAGGDLRVFGAHSSKVHLRHPAFPQTFAHTINVRQTALATSSPCFTEHDWRGPCGRPPSRVSHLVNPLSRAAITGAISVTVLARECWLADALTKIVLIAPHLAQPALAKYGAKALVITA